MSGTCSTTLLCYRKSAYYINGGCHYTPPLHYTSCSTVWLPVITPSQTKLHLLSYYPDALHSVEMYYIDRKNDYTRVPSPSPTVDPGVVRGGGGIAAMVQQRRDTLRTTYAETAVC